MKRTHSFYKRPKVTDNVTLGAGDGDHVVNVDPPAEKKAYSFWRVAERLSGFAMKMAQCTVFMVKPVGERLQVTLRSPPIPHILSVSGGILNKRNLFYIIVVVLLNFWWVLQSFCCCS